MFLRNCKDHSFEELKGVGLGNTKIFLSFNFVYIYIIEKVEVHASSAKVLRKFTVSFYI